MTVIRIGNEYQADIREEEEEDWAQGREGTRVRVVGEEKVEEGGEGRKYITTRKEGDRGEEGEEGGRTHVQQPKHLAEDDRWEERAIKTDEAGVKREWEIWYRRPGAQNEEADLWLMVKDEKNSKGRYLIAGKDFDDKEAIVTYRGNAISKKELRTLEERGDGDHVMQIGAELIDGRMHVCGGQYMNTAVWEEEKNNVKMMGAPYGTLRADKKGGIKRGEELLLDYGKTYWASKERQQLLQRIWDAG